MKRLLWPFVLISLFAVACGPAAATPTQELVATSAPPAPTQELVAPPVPTAPAPTAETQPAPTAAPQPTALPEARSAAPTMATCRAWIQENHSLDYSNHGCQEHADILRSVERMGGGVIPVGENRFFIVWFPEGWERSSDPEVVFTIHGNGGCAENNFKWWSEVAEAHDYAVVALQYAEEDVADTNPREDFVFDRADAVYPNLVAAYDELRAHCPLGDAPIVLHGFSRGSAMNYNLALMDRGAKGRRLFSAFIADSGGTGPAGTGDTPPGYLKDAPPNAYQGARFWLYCGMKDEDGVRCDDMEKARQLIQAHGGIVDELYVNPTGAHGIFIRGRTETTTPAIEAMLAYIDAIEYSEPAPGPTGEQPPAPTAAPTETSSAGGGAAPTLASCRAWLQENHSLDYPGHGCQEQADVLNSVADQGGSVIPLQDDRFFIARFPDNWEQQAHKTLIVTLHGSGGCAERLYQWWSRPAAERGYALVALQYARADATTEEGYAFDDADQIYDNLRTVFAELEAHCPLDDATVVYHGFSRGSARSFEIALLDRAADGMGVFDAFLSDSGTGFAETGGEMPDYLETAGPDAYQGARFWLYCGGKDHEGKTCEGMKRMGPLLEERGATVDTYRYAPGGHGVFATVEPGGPPSPALRAMLAYVDSLSDR